MTHLQTLEEAREAAMAWQVRAAANAGKARAAWGAAAKAECAARAAWRAADEARDAAWREWGAADE